MPRVHYLGNMGPAKGPIIDVKNVCAHVQGATLGENNGSCKGAFQKNVCHESLKKCIKMCLPVAQFGQEVMCVLSRAAAILAATHMFEMTFGH
jgi:hypothetical protein